MHYPFANTSFPTTSLPCVTPSPTQHDAAERAEAEAQDTLIIVCKWWALPLSHALPLCQHSLSNCLSPMHYPPPTQHDEAERAEAEAQGSLVTICMRLASIPSEWAGSALGRELGCLVGEESEWLLG